MTLVTFGLVSLGSLIAVWRQDEKQWLISFLLALLIGFILLAWIYITMELRSPKSIQFFNGEIVFFYKNQLDEWKISDIDVEERAFVARTGNKRRSLVFKNRLSGDYIVMDADDWKGFKAIRERVIALKMLEVKNG